MDAAALATAMVSAQASQTQSALAAKMMKMNAGQDQAIAQMLDAAVQNADRLANVAAGVGQSVDISA